MQQISLTEFSQMIAREMARVIDKMGEAMVTKDK
jgi:hypothetical protein